MPAHRVPAAIALAAGLALAGAGCASFDSSLGQQEAVVQFRPQTPVAVQLRVRGACSHLPNAAPEPLPSHRNALTMTYGVRYQVGNASDADIARLQQCLQKFPSVIGIEFSGPSGS